MSNAKYRKLSVTDVGNEAWAAYERAKAAYKVYSELKREAEALAIAQLPALPASVAYVFTYNYGNWSVFLGEPKAQPARRVVGSLEDWIVQQNGQGRAI